MPLTGQAKADYQREYMRGYMRRKRAEGLNVTEPITPQGLNIGLNKGLNKPSESELIAEVELDADGNEIPEY